MSRPEVAGDFPVYKSHAEVVCWRCHNVHGGLGDHERSGHAQGHGEFEKRCTRCDVFIWYDIAPADARGRT